MKIALTHFPIVGDAGVSGAVHDARSRGHGQEVSAVAVARPPAPVGGGVGRHFEGKAVVHTRTLALH